MILQEVRGKDERRYELQSDGNTCWVNGPDGGAVGRFSRSFIDVHSPTQQQADEGKACLDCGPVKDPLQDWGRFKKAMLDIYGITVPDDFAPATVRLLLPEPQILHPFDRKKR